MRRRFQSIIILLGLVGLGANAKAMSYGLHGYYRARSVANADLDLQTPNSSIPNSNDRFGFIAYNQMRLRLEPTLKLNDFLAIHGLFDVLDNILFGTEETRELGVNAPIIGTLTLPPGAGSFWMTGGNAGENAAFNVRAVWTEILSPIGLFRIGRQPSHWGLGIFQNDGRARQSDFGDMADRVLYLAQIDLAGSSSVSAGLLWDIPFEAQFDPRAQGLDGQIRSNAQDAHQFGTFVLYDREDWNVGLFGGYRRRDGPEGATTTTVRDAAGNSVAAGSDGNTNLFFADLYGKYQLNQYRFQIEGVYVGGKVTTGVAADGIAFQGLGAGTGCGSGGIICMPANQPIQVLMAAMEIDAEYDFGGEWNLKSGFAQGDGNILSSKVTQLGFRPDYQIALMMFNMPLGTSPTFYDGTSGARLAGGVPTTGNYINNALYASTGYKHRFNFPEDFPGEWFKLGTQITTAWAHQKNINLDFAELTGTANLPEISESADSMWKRWYGVELDVSAEVKVLEHLYAALEGGFLLPGRAYDIDVNLVNPGSIVAQVPDDKAQYAWMIRLTTSIEF
ncbi:MAG: hypothetical protein HY465_00555 [Deltaproteobacteria bacterium]|nr:hypothetical protein [Deltaproteobacteria bacterium]